MIEELSADEAEALWPSLESSVRQAMHRLGMQSEMMLDQMRQGVSTGLAQVLLGKDGVGIVYQDDKVLHLLSYTGTLFELRAMAPEFYAYARQRGAERIRITGHRAWMRVFPALKEKCLVMEVDINGGRQEKENPR